MVKLKRKRINKKRLDLRKGHIKGKSEYIYIYIYIYKYKYIYIYIYIYI